MSKLYYTAPSDEIFAEMKTVALEVWKQYDTPEHPGGYYQEKVDAIKDIGNIQDNFMYMFAGFDGNNQRIVVSKLSVEAQDELRERLIDGGSERWYLTALGL